MSIFDGWDIPKDKNYPTNSVQCNSCGGHGCEDCDDKGWLFPIDHPNGRRCENEKCNLPLFPNQVALYCSNQCAFKDA